MKNILRLLKIGIARGRVTYRYPKDRTPVPEGLRGKPELNFDVCIGCGACVKACPPNALVMDDHEGTRTIKLFYGQCIMCGTCEEVCPVDAIRVFEEFELASLNREDLEEVLQFALVKCKSCGNYFTTKRVLENTLSAYSELVSGYGEEFIEKIFLCPDCRRKDWSEVLAEVYRGARHE